MEQDHPSCLMITNIGGVGSGERLEQQRCASTRRIACFLLQRVFGLSRGQCNRYAREVLMGHYKFGLAQPVLPLPTAQACWGNRSGRLSANSPIKTPLYVIVEKT